MRIDRWPRKQRPLLFGRLSEERGQAALEFVLVLPVLFLVVVIAVEILQVVAGVSGAFVDYRNSALEQAVVYNDDYYGVEPRPMDTTLDPLDVPVLGGLKGLFPNGIRVNLAPDKYRVWSGTNRSVPLYPN